MDVRSGHDACKENDLEELIQAVKNGVLTRQIFSKKTLLLEVSFKDRAVTELEHDRKPEDFYAKVRKSLLEVGLECDAINITSRTFDMKDPMENSVLIGLDLKIVFR